MINDVRVTLHTTLAIGLIEYLSTLPLYELCQEQLGDACYLIDQCCLRIQTHGVNNDLSSMCIKTTIYEEAIFQYVSTDKRARLAHWVRQYSSCYSASDRYWLIGCPTENVLMAARNTPPPTLPATTSVQGR